MGFPAIVSTILYIFGLVFLIFWYLDRKKNKKSADIFKTLSIIAFVNFFLILLYSLLTNDPIPYFNIIAFIGLMTVGTLFSLFAPKEIASEVKKELMLEKKIEYRTLKIAEARKEITEYLEHRKKETWIEDVVEDLSIEPKTVIEVLKELHKEGMIKEVK